MILTQCGCQVMILSALSCHSDTIGVERFNMKAQYGTSHHLTTEICQHCMNTNNSMYCIICPIIAHSFLSGWVFSGQVLWCGLVLSKVVCCCRVSLIMFGFRWVRFGPIGSNWILLGLIVSILVWLCLVWSGWFQGSGWGRFGHDMGTWQAVKKIMGLK